MSINPALFWSLWISDAESITPKLTHTWLNTEAETDVEELIYFSFLKIFFHSKLNLCCKWASILFPFILKEWTLYAPLRTRFAVDTSPPTFIWPNEGFYCEDWLFWNLWIRLLIGVIVLALFTVYLFLESKDWIWLRCLISWSRVLKSFWEIDGRLWADCEIGKVCRSIFIAGIILAELILFVSC